MNYRNQLQEAYNQGHRQGLNEVGLPWQTLGDLAAADWNAPYDGPHPEEDMGDQWFEWLKHRKARIAWQRQRYLELLNNQYFAR